MTIIAWNGLTVAADSLTTDLTTKLCSQSLKIQRLITPLKIDNKNPAVITAICGAGSRKVTEPITKALVGLEDSTIKDFLYTREKMGAMWPVWDTCQIGLIGMLRDQPYFAVIREGKIIPARGPVTLGVTNTPIDLFVKSMGSPAEFVYVINHLYPEYCGGEITTYDPTTRDLNFVDTTKYNTEDIKSKLQKAFNDYLSKIDDPNNLRYPATFAEEEVENDE